MMRSSVVFLTLVILTSTSVVAEERGDPTPPGAGVSAALLKKMGYGQVRFRKVGATWVASALKAGTGERITLDPLMGNIVRPAGKSAQTGNKKPRRKHRVAR